MSEEGEIANVREEFFIMIMSVFWHQRYKEFILKQYLEEAIEELQEKLLREYVLKKLRNLLHGF